jgi:hypothetical protein
MNHFVRAVSVLVLLAVAAPALPCGDKASTTASNEPSTSQEKKQAVAKSDVKKAGAKAKASSEQKKTAAN